MQFKDGERVWRNYSTHFYSTVILMCLLSIGIQAKKVVKPKILLMSPVCVIFVERRSSIRNHCTLIVELTQIQRLSVTYVVPHWRVHDTYITIYCCTKMWKSHTSVTNVKKPFSPAAHLKVSFTCTSSSFMFKFY